MKTLTIWVLCHWNQPIGQPFVWWLESYTYHFIQSLREYWYKLMIYAHSESNLWCSFSPYPRLLEASNLQEWLEWESEELAADIDIKYALERMERTCDIIINNTLSKEPITWQEHSTIPIITTLHINPHYNPYTHGIIDLKIRKKHRRPIVSISQNSASQRRAFIPDIITIPNGVRLESWEYTTSVNTENSYMARAWRICPEKWTKDAVQIARKSWCRLKIAWKIYDRTYFEEHIKPYLSNTIEYIGNLSHKDLNSFFMNAQAFWFTSTWQEPFGLVQIEALASWTPIVAYRSGAANDIVVPEVWRLVEIWDQSWFIHALEDIPMLSREACRKHVEKHYSRDGMMKQYIQLIHTTLWRTYKKKWIKWNVQKLINSRLELMKVPLIQS